MHKVIYRDPDSIKGEAERRLSRVEHTSDAINTHKEEGNQSAAERRAPQMTAHEFSSLIHLTINIRKRKECNSTRVLA